MTWFYATRSCLSECMKRPLGGQDQGDADRWRSVSRPTAMPDGPVLGLGDCYRVECGRTPDVSSTGRTWLCVIMNGLVKPHSGYNFMTLYITSKGSRYMIVPAKCNIIVLSHPYLRPKWSPSWSPWHCSYLVNHNNIIQQCMVKRRFHTKMSHWCNQVLGRKK